MNKILFSIIIISTGLNLAGQYKNINLEPDKGGMFNYQMIEQVDLNTDQDFYLSGENIWFSVYTYDASFYLPVKFSVIAYVELYTQDNQVVAQQKVKLDDGRGIGSIRIPKTLQTDYYYLRAYTNFMRNYGPSFFHTQRIEIINPFYQVPIRRKRKEIFSEFALHVIPEGGDILYNMRNKLVYYSTTSNGYCKEIIARLVDDNDSVILNTKTVNGIGSFLFVPNLGRQYRIEAIACGEKVSVQLLTPVEKSNAILIDSLSMNKAYLQILSKEKDLSNLILRVINNGIQYNSGFLSDELSKASITLPEGINILQLINLKEDVLASRYVAVNRDKNINILISSGPINAHKRQQIDIGIKTTDQSGNLVVSDLSLSVSLNNDKNEPSKDNERWHHIQLLNMNRIFPDIPVVEYRSYLNDIELLNNYLLTKSGHSENPQNLRIGNTFLPELKTDLISGYIQDENNVRAANKTVLHAFVDSIAWLNVDVTDSIGNFLLKIPDEHTGSDMFVIVKDTSTRYKINLNSEFSEEFIEMKKEPYFPDKSLKEQIQKRMVNLQVQDAYNLDETDGNNSGSELRFYGYPDNSYLFDDYINLPNMEEFVFEIVAGAIVERRRKKVSIYVLSEETTQVIGKEPLYIIDGIPVFDKQMISEIPPEIMDRFNVVTNKYYYFSESFDGIIDLTSKKGDFSDFDPPQNALRTDFVPVQRLKLKRKEIGDAQVKQMNIPIYQTTLYFNTRITTNEAGSAEVKFYVPDNSCNYSVTVNAIDKKGQSGFAYYPDFIKVED